MADLELCFTPAKELARRIRTKEVSPVDIVKNSLERIDEVNPALNCFCFVFADEALERAKQAEAAVIRGDDLGALHGVPIAIKDFTPTKGKTTTMGSKVYRDWVPDDDAQIVKDLTGAGAIMVGKTTTPEFAHAGFTTQPVMGRYAQSLEPGTHARRILRRFWCRRIVGLRAAGRRFRHGWIRPHPGFLLRHRRVETQPGPYPDDRVAHGVRQHFPFRTAGPNHR